MSCPRSPPVWPSGGGRDAVHCPYCHGWEIRDQRIGLLATGPISAMQTMLFHQWSERMTFLPNGLDVPPAEQLEKLRALGITIRTGAVRTVETTDDRLTAVVMDDGARVELDALAVPPAPPTRVRLDGLEGLG